MGLARVMLVSQRMEGRPPVAAVFNTSPDTIEMLRIVLEPEGFRDGHPVYL